MPPPERIDTATVIARAVSIVDRDGVDALSFRRLAGECGVTAMALYRHVRDKDELLDRVVEQVLGEFVIGPPATGRWREQLTEFFLQARRMFLDHPGIAAICMQRPTPVTAVGQIYERVLEGLTQGGITGQDAVYAFDTLLMFMFGSVLWELPRSELERERLLRLALAEPADTPQLIAHATELAHRNAADYYEQGLATILDGLETRRDATRQP
ncbi:MAG TPA: TetR/AcrR family transcriptional regulator C-terminal domain-containing protein [Solirubrobacteraceae bacterium]|jgi:AcrR family transcriptional regulator|nr:TetR/AcrR family transcriptional regulator C-terminal domain-containing protein [Solirubrobacteraceae bacterium]